MAYPASQQVLSDALTAVHRKALELKADSQQRVATMAAQNVTGVYVLDILGRMNAAVAAFDSGAAVPGIAAYAKDQYSDPNLDVAGEFTAMRAAAVAVRGWIVANMPQGSGFLEIRSLDANGAIVERTFTPAQTAGLRTVLAALIATIG